MNIQQRTQWTFKIILFSLFFLPNLSHAMLDLRLTYGIITAKDQATDACGANCTSALPSVVPFGGLGADAIISPPMTSFGFGVRYENLALKASASPVDVDAGIERIALIVNYRLIDTIIHLGPIFTYGISTKSKMNITESGTPRVDYSSSSADSLSAGLEVGIKPLIVVPLVIGAEAGYNYLKVKNATDSVHNTSTDMDFSGVYLKAFLGLSF